MPEHLAVDLTFREEVRDSDVLLVRSLASSSGFFRPGEIDVAVELVEERLREGSHSTYRFVFAELEGRPAGYACYGEIPCTVGSFDLYWIIVDSSLQGMGIGRRLMKKSEALIAAAGGRKVYVETSSTARYKPTRAFYHACGYQKVAELPDFYLAGDDKVIYEKTTTV